MGYRCYGPGVGRVRRRMRLRCWLSMFMYTLAMKDNGFRSLMCFRSATTILTLERVSGIHLASRSAGHTRHVIDSVLAKRLGCVIAGMIQA